MSDSRWFSGPFGFTLADPVALPFVPIKGALGFFEVPDELVPAGAAATPLRSPDSSDYFPVNPDFFLHRKVNA